MSDFRERLEEELEEVLQIEENLTDRGIKLKEFISEIIEKGEVPHFLTLLDYSMLVAQNEIMAGLLEKVQAYKDILEQRVKVIDNK